MRRWSSVGLLLLVLGVVPTTAACGTCDVDCGDSAELTTFTGMLLHVDGDTATFAGPIAVTVPDHIGYLDIGAEYRVSAARASGADAGLTAEIDADCACTAITHADGTAIDLGWWREWPIREILAVVIGVPLLTIVAVVVRRIVRGPDDPYRDLPDDGEWVEFDGGSF